MKAILLISFLWAFAVNAQPPQKVNSNYQFKAAGADSGGFRVPIYQVLPAVPNHYFVDSGAIAFQLSDSSHYYWYKGAWHKLRLSAIGGGDTIVNGNIEIGGTLLKSPVTHYNNFNFVSSFPPPGTGDAGNITRVVLNPDNGTRTSPWSEIFESVRSGQGDTSHNNVYKIGWNINRQFKPGLPGNHDAWENHYVPGAGPGGRYLERHYELSLPDGNQTRLFSFTTILTPSDSSIQTSQTDNRFSKWNFMSLQSDQNIEVDCNGGQSDMIFYQNQRTNTHQVKFGWDFTDTTHFGIIDFGGGSNTLDFGGWGQTNIDGSIKLGGTQQLVPNFNGNAAAILGDIWPNQLFDNVYKIGDQTARFADFHCVKETLQNSIISDNVSNVQDPSSALEIKSTTRGVLFPRMTTVQKLAISSPAEGLQVYDLTLHQMSYYNGTTWINF